MKSNLSTNPVLRLAMASLFFVGLFLFAPSTMEAQVSTTLTNSNHVTAVTYVAPSVAITRVEDHCIWLKGQYDVLDPVSQAYRDNEAKYAFYNAILNNLKEGMTVAESIESATLVLNTDAVGTLSKAKKEEFKNEAINLLKQ